MLGGVAPLPPPASARTTFVIKSQDSLLAQARTAPEGPDSPFTLYRVRTSG